jgi:very-short-patch-repair endonuclease
VADRSIRIARSLRRRATDAERRLWAVLRDRALVGARFRRQQPIGPYVVDFCCLERKLVVEVDGSQHLDRTAADARRTGDLELAGFRVLRFWNNQVLLETDAVLEAIRQAIETPSP